MTGEYCRYGSGVTDPSRRETNNWMMLIIGVGLGAVCYTEIICSGSMYQASQWVSLTVESSRMAAGGVMLSSG